MRLQGRTALVTGGSRGIGRAACLAFAGEGAAVAVHCRERRAEADEVVAAIAAGGGRATSVQADVTQRADVERMLREVAGFAGDEGLHVLFANAGIYPEGGLDSLTVDEWDHVLAVNVRGPFLCVQAALPLLERADDARVITIGSVMPYLGVPGMLHYATSKAAIAGFTRCLARELAERGVTVNCVVPSMVATGTALTDYPGVEEWAIAQQAIKRYQQPDDLTGALLFLASTESAFMTGQTLVVDGGRVML